MKPFILLISMFSFSFSYSQYVFNFSTGKSANWSNPANWNGGVVPPLAVNTISIIPPDDSDGWLCQLDVDGVTCNSKFIVSGHATLSVMPGIKLYFHDSLRIDSKASFIVNGDLKLLCPVKILNNGIFTIAATGTTKFNDPFTCPDDPSYLINNGPFYVNGTLNFDASYLVCNNLFWNKGLIQLFDQSHLTCTGDAFNDGTISGGIIFSQKSLPIKEGLNYQELVHMQYPFNAVSIL